MTDEHGSNDQGKTAGDQARTKDDKAPPSFAANVLNSAAGLLQDALSPRDSQVGSSLSHALASGGKGESSSSGPSSFSGTSGQRPAFNQPTSSGAVAGAATFRTSTTHPPVQQEAFEGMTLDQFIDSGSNNQDALFEDDHKLYKGKAPIREAPAFHTVGQSHEGQLESAWSSASRTWPFQAAAKGPTTDGGEVVSLLSDPTFQPGAWTEEDLQDETPYTISEEERQISQWFVQKSQEGPSQQRQLHNAVDAARAGHPFEEFASIFDDIENYQEDVWGYVAPLVKAAKEESQRQPQSVEDGPAVRRLRMVLAHFQTPNSRNSSSL